MKYIYYLLLVIHCLLLSPLYAQDNDESNFIKAGQPVFLIVIGDNCAIEENVAEREMTELTKNFHSLDPEVRMIWLAREPLTFDNNKQSIINFDDQEEGKSCAKVVYWDGKKTSKPLLYDDITRATEFFSPKLLKKKITSSYYDEFQQRLKNFEQKKEHVTAHSKEVSDRYVKDVLITQGLFNFPFFPMNFKGVKSITLKQNNAMLLKFYLNEEGLLTRIDKVEGEKGLEFKYEDGLLRQLVDYAYEPDPLITEFLYNDKELFQKITKEEMTPFDGKHFIYNCSYYQLQDDFVNQHKVIFNTDGWSFFERITKREGNKIIEKDDSNETIYTLSNTKNYLPITVEYGYDSENSPQKITQKTPLLWILQDDYKLGEFHWNKQGRITKIVAKYKKTGKVESTYYYQYEMY